MTEPKNTLAMPKIWLLTNIPSPYQVELLTAVDRLLQGGLAVRFFGTRRASDGPLEGLPFANLGLRTLGWGKRPETWLHPTAFQECRGGDWDAYVLSGTIASPTLLRCASILKKRGKPSILWLERPHPKHAEAPWSPRWLTSGPTRWLKDRIAKRLVRQATGLIAMGSAACREYQEWGLEPHRVRSQPYAIDANRFQRPLAATPPRDDKSKTILFSGQWIPRKGIEELCKIFALIQAKRQDVELLILGEGPLRGYLEQQQQLYPGHITLVGKVEQQALPGYFHRADLFLFPSRHDGWGVVVNEAIAASLPVITTLQTGAAHDLVLPGRNGFLLDRDDLAGMAEAVLKILADDTLCRTMAVESWQLAQAHSIEVSAKRWIENVQILSRGQSKPEGVAG